MGLRFQTNVTSTNRRYKSSSDVGMHFDEDADLSDGGFLGGLGALISRGLSNLLRRFTGTGLTEADRQATQINIDNAREQREWEKGLSDTAYQREVADMQKAGLNPALLYSNGSSGASTPSGAVATTQEISSPTSFQDLINAMSLPLQLKKMSADIIKTKEESETEKQRRENMSAEYDNIKASFNEILSRTDLNDAQRSNLVTMGKYIDRMQEANLANIEADTKLKQSTKHRIDELLQGEKDIQIRTYEDFKHRWDLMEKEAAKLATEEQVLQKDIENYMLNHMDSGWLGTGLSLTNILRFVLESLGLPPDAIKFPNA